MMFKENPIDVIESKEFSKIQLLIHPIWGVAKGATAEKKRINAIKQNFEREEKTILSTKRVYGKKKYKNNLKK
jgi:hypothetical protein